MRQMDQPFGKSLRDPLGGFECGRRPRIAVPLFAGTVIRSGLYEKVRTPPPQSVGPGFGAFFGE